MNHTKRPRFGAPMAFVTLTTLVLPGQSGSFLRRAAVNERFLSNKGPKSRTVALLGRKRRTFLREENGKHLGEIPIQSIRETASEQRLRDTSTTASVEHPANALSNGHTPDILNNAIAAASAAIDLTNPNGDKTKRTKRTKRHLSAETKRKIGEALLGRRKSDEMRERVSQKMKGRVPWNKGKKLSAETRARMSEARFGRIPWNKGRALTAAHRNAISLGGRSRTVSEKSRNRMRMARRRPGDAIVSGGLPAETKNGTYPLLDTPDIHEYVSLRRELKVWSDCFSKHNNRRPSLADVRRTAPPRIIGKFERYVGMRNRMRGLASDVYCSLIPEAIPVVIPRDTASSPQNNNAGTVVQLTANGNPRLVAEYQPILKQSISSKDDLLDEDANDDEDPDSWQTVDQNDEKPWDIYDLPMNTNFASGTITDDKFVVSPGGAKTASSEVEGRMSHVTGKSSFSANDYRAIGRYRLVESIDLNNYVRLRRELLGWSSAFKEKHGHVPSLSDVSHLGDTTLYRKFCQYIECRDRVNGLVTEVCGMRMDNVEELQKVSETGRDLVHRLHSDVKTRLDSDEA